MSRTSCSVMIVQSFCIDSKHGIGEPTARSDVSIGLLLVRTARMGDSAIDRRPDLLGIFPQRARRVVGSTRSPFGLPLSKFGVGQFHADSPGHSIDLDDVAVAKQPDRAAHSRLRTNMADAEAARCAGEAAIGDERDLAAHALPGQRRRGREHLAHSGTAAWPLVADHDDLALFVGSLLDGIESILLAVEATGRS